LLHPPGRAGERAERTPARRPCRSRGHRPRAPLSPPADLPGRAPATGPHFGLTAPGARLDD